jgi:cytosine/adenosine deaminase-related metal-dependent hydrolase/ketosteroid isomerase-like protein
MKSICGLLPIVLCVTGAAQNGPKSSAHTPIYITHVVVIDTETGREAQDQTVVISGEKILDVLKSSNASVRTEAKVVDGRGKFLIPGLWDMHVHGTKFDSTLPLYIANGVTGVREMWGPPDANKFRAELAAKHLIAPHIYIGSPGVDGKPPIWPGVSIEVTTADEARRAVDDQKQRGADFIKVYSVLSRDAYFAVVDEARRQNIPVAGHVPNSVSIWEVTAARQRSIEHSFGIEVGCSSREKEFRPKFLVEQRNRKEWEALRFEAWQSYSDERCKKLFAELKKNGTWPVPTLVVHHAFGRLHDPQFTSDNRLRYFSGEFRDWVNGSLDPRMKDSASDFAKMRATFAAEEKVTGQLFRAGVPMLAGTDVGNAFCFPGFSLHDELALLVESGLTPLAALQSATRNPAIFMNATDRYGSVAKGKIADLVLLDADPLQDIHNTIKVAEVFLDGKEFDRTALDLILKDAEQKASASLGADSNQRVQDVDERIQQVLAVDDARRLAMLHGDTDALDHLLADDATIFWGDGTVDDKPSTLELFRSGRLRYRQLDYDNTRVQLYGDAAVVTGSARVQAQSGEQALEHTARVTRVYLHKQDRWRLAMSQTTRVDPASQSTTKNREQQPLSAMQVGDNAGKLGDRERFIGTWQLVSSEDRLRDGSTRPYPTLGPHGKGYLIYTADGQMCAVLMNPDRPLWKDANRPTATEKLEAFSAFNGYCGRYGVDEAAHIMYHFPEISRSPNFIGTKQKRPYIFKGDVLQFADTESTEPSVESWIITWR